MMCRGRMQTTALTALYCSHLSTAEKVRAMVGVVRKAWDIML
jgi:hypothetical protein